jgi:NADPH-dependent curcumin reductase CurA
MDSVRVLEIPTMFRGVGYTGQRDGLPLEEIEVPVPRPTADQVLIHVAYSSLNPLEYKLAELNFFGRMPPVILGDGLQAMKMGKSPMGKVAVVVDQARANR